LNSRRFISLATLAISSSARPQDQEWLSALRQAMNESDAAVKKMAEVAGPLPDPPPQAGEGTD
jgi:hypothetical protein